MGSRTPLLQWAVNLESLVSTVSLHETVRRRGRRAVRWQLSSTNRQTPNMRIIVMGTAATASI